ncbi:cerebellin-3-like [Tachysurus ichikawai]
MNHCAVCSCSTPPSGSCGRPKRCFHGSSVFRVFSKAAGRPANSMTAGLYKNGQHMFSTHAHQTGGFYSLSNGASLPLEKGDTVSVRLYAGTWIFDNGEHHHSSFSGHLLFPL